MKHLLFCILSITFSSALYAQLNKGQWLVGGNASFAYAFSKDTDGHSTYSFKTTGLQVSPGAGYFFLDKLCAGIRPGLTVSNTSEESTFPIVGGTATSSSKSNSTGWGIAPFARYYFLPKANKVNLLAELSFAYNHNKTHTENSNVSIQNGLPIVNSSVSDYKYHTVIYTISAGPVIFINPKVALEFTVGYSIYRAKSPGGDQNTVTAGAGFNIHLDRGKK